MDRQVIKAIANIDQLWTEMTYTVMNDPDYFGDLMLKALDDKTNYRQSLSKLSEKELGAVVHLANLALNKMFIEGMSIQQSKIEGE